MLEGLRSTLYRALAGADLPMRLNTVLGRPLAPREELAERGAARARLADLRARRATGAKTDEASAPATPREAAPVMIYFEKDRNVRELERTREALDARGVPYKLLDVAGDEAALDYVLRTSKRKEDELPVVFVAGQPVGGFREVVEADVSGELARLVWGARG